MELGKEKINDTLFSRKVAEELLSIYGSPLYVYDAVSLHRTIECITKAISYPRTQFHFASVTNGNVALLQIFRNAGWGLHANTPGDIYLGLEAGFHPSQIVYSGSNLNHAEMEQVLDWGVTTLNLDSIAQLQLCCEVLAEKDKPNFLRLGLRLNFPEITGDSRIGVHPEEFHTALNITQKAGLKLSGLHFYRGTGTNATQAFTEVINKVIATAQMLPDWEYLDFGGGFGYPYHHGGVAFDWQEFGKKITDKINSLDKKIDLIIEPGRAAIARCGTLLARVISVKWQDKKQIIGVDTTIANITVLSVHGGYREILVCKEKTEIYDSHTYITDICGNTTYSRDYLGKNCQLPALEIGDIIAILDVGAYGYAMSSHFLHRPKPAEILVEDYEHRLIRMREDYSVLLKNQVFTSNQ